MHITTESFYKRDDQSSRISPEASPSRRAGLPPYKHPLRLKKQKCRFVQPSVEYLGYVIDKEDIHPMSRKVEAVCSFKCY